jgi:hypothetical protein
MLDRKGHIPTLLLVVAALVLAVASLFSFISFKDSIRGMDDQFVSLIEKTSYTQAYLPALSAWLLRDAYFDAYTGTVAPSVEEVSRTLVQRAEAFDGSTQLNSDFFGKIRSEDFQIVLLNSTYTLHISNVSIFSHSGINELTRTYSFSVSYTPSAEGL